MRIRQVAQSKVRYGYRKIRVLLNRKKLECGEAFGAPAVQRKRTGAEEKG